MGLYEELLELEQLDLIRLLEKDGEIRVDLTEHGEDVQLALHQLTDGVWHAGGDLGRSTRCRRRRRGWCP
jgi:hypothetical protein